MDLQASTLLLGSHKGVQYKQNTNIDEFNSRIGERQFADSALEPNFDIRPVSTKYAHFPILNGRKPITEEKKQYIDYKSSNNFTPTVSKGPVSGYMTNVDTETILRNQPFALQKGLGQDIYVPSSKSDLYNVSVVSRPSNQPHLGLFDKQNFSNRPHPNVANSSIGTDKFFNHTRTQLRSDM